MTTRVDFYCPKCRKQTDTLLRLYVIEPGDRYKDCPECGRMFRVQTLFRELGADNPNPATQAVVVAKGDKVGQAMIGETSKESDNARLD